MSIIEDYIKASDEASDYSDARMDAIRQRALEDIDALMTDPRVRDAPLWLSLGVDHTLPLDAVLEEGERNLEWTGAVAEIGAASSVQFFLDQKEETIVKPLAYREMVLAGFALTAAQLIQAGKRGFEVIGQATFQKLQASIFTEINAIMAVDSVTLFAELSEIGAIRPFEELVSDSIAYVSRMTGYPPGSPQMMEAVSDLVDYQSKRAINGMNRRAIQRLHTAREIDGDNNRKLAWIVEGGKSTCSYCASRAGEVRTYLAWLDYGMPGASVCKGGDNCRCQLAAI